MRSFTEVKLYVERRVKSYFRERGADAVRRYCERPALVKRFAQQSYKVQYLHTVIISLKSLRKMRKEP